MRRLVVAGLCALVACSAPKKDDPLPTDDCSLHGTGGTALPAPKCTAGTRWTAGKQAFSEKTKDWGLDALGVVGTRLSVIDLDKDGWPDLAVRSVGVQGDDFTDPKKRRN